MSETKKELVRMLAHYGNVGFTFVAAIFIGLGAGIYLDQKVFDEKTAPWFTFIGLAFGIAAGFKTLFEILWKQQRQEKKDNESEQ